MRNPMTRQPTLTPAVRVARIAADEATAKRISDVLAESVDPAEATVAAFATGSGWTVELYFLRPPDEAAIRDLVALGAGRDAAQALTFETLAARDWTKESLEGLKPVDAGRFVVHGGHDRQHVAANRIGIEIEAALAFGTGHHGTTRGCLLALDRLARARRPRRILDIGSGTGVLAIAAAKALRTVIVASDIDARAIDVAKANARLNRTLGITFVHAAGLGARPVREPGPYDLIFANILLGPLKRLARPMARLVAPDGRLILSGLLSSQANAALSAYRMQGLALDRRTDLEGWATLVLRRGPPVRE